MLRVGLTGNLGSGKSTVAALFAEKGAHILASDAIGRELMQPSQPVFQAVANHFGPAVLAPDGTLDRVALARIAFSEGRTDHLEALNAIVHPAVIARQAKLAEELFSRDANAVLLVESALIFETNHAAHAPRFDKILLVVAAQADKIARFVRRANPVATPEEQAALQAEARNRLVLQIPDNRNLLRSDYVITNDGSLAELRAQVDTLWPILQEASRHQLPLDPSTHPKT